MKATVELMEEHRVIERVLAALEAATDRLEAGQDVRPEFFLDVSPSSRDLQMGATT
jgi:hemerythrin-like domain-containing protein